MVVVTAVHVMVNEGSVEAFAEATLDNHRHSVKEPGNLRFDVLNSVENPNEFLLYEVYRDEEGMKAHKQTLHYARWAESVLPWMSEPRNPTIFLRRIRFHTRHNPMATAGHACVSACRKPRPAPNG